MKRQNYVQWCKDRAMEYVTAGDLKNAVMSMLSDMKKNSETDSPILGILMIAGMDAARQNDTQAITKWIQGFN